jgi:hypothetical protein
MPSCKLDSTRLYRAPQNIACIDQKMEVPIPLKGMVDLMIHSSTLLAHKSYTHDNRHIAIQQMNEVSVLGEIRNDHGKLNYILYIQRMVESMERLEFLVSLHQVIVCSSIDSYDNPSMS